MEASPATVIRGTPNYRNSGAWYDCVYVTYEDDNNEKKYPFQVHAFFMQRGRQSKLAVGRMGLQKKNHSPLMDEWTYEKQYRIVDLETISQAVFALTIPTSCFKTDGGQTPCRMYVLKDRMTEWPVIFDQNDWKDREANENTRKRKTRR